MSLAPSTYLINKWLDAAFNGVSFSVTTVYVKLHIGDPGAAGTANPATETTRKALSCSAAALAAITSDANLTWIGIAGSQDATHFSLWDDLTAGNFLGSGTITGAPYTAGATYVITAGNWDLSMTAAA